MEIRQASNRRTTDEWEARVGEQVRDLRQRAGLTQTDLAKRANVSIGALQNLEYGAGSRLATLIQVTRALGRGSWLEEIAPPVSTSPMQLLNERRTLGLRRSISDAAEKNARDSKIDEEVEPHDVSGG